ncbi:DUF4479 domain-containing protein, partial [Staphylococcus aureus]|nr:DUF4479 domain-containing protein [Staphylococcus aureus]
MNLFYNKEGVGDVAFLQIEPTNGPFEYKKSGDVVEISKEGTIVGFNLFKFSNYHQINGNGHIKLTSELVDALQKAINES